MEVIGDGSEVGGVDDLEVACEIVRFGSCLEDDLGCFWDYKRDCYLGVPLESQTTGPRATHLPLVEVVFVTHLCKQFQP